MFHPLTKLYSDLDIDISLLNITGLDVNDVTCYPLIAQMCEDLFFYSYDWIILAGRVYLQFAIRNVPETFSDAMSKMSLHPDMYNFVIQNANVLNAMINHSRDNAFTYCGIRTLENGYLGKYETQDKNVVVVESPQYMYLRVATFLWYPDISKIEETYNALSTWKYSHASPTMFNAGMKIPALSSCFCIDTQDTLKDIADKWRVEAIISKNGGGIGKSFSRVRHSRIGMNGAVSKGIVPWIRIDNTIMPACDQSGKRKGSMCEYLRDFHVDIIDFVELGLKGGAEDLRARELFYGIMVSDLFMRRIEENGVWSLFCPNKVPSLATTFGKDFENAYVSAEQRGLAVKQMSARTLWFKILTTQIESGGPFICYIDAINRKCNQVHNGEMVHMSNLCTEITGITNAKEIMSCNLASVSLNACVVEKVNDDGTKSNVFSFDILEASARALVRNLNQVIDRTFYPDEIPEIRYANMRRRPLGIGVQGLADTFAMLNIAWDSASARDLNYSIFETLYISCVEESVEIAKEEGKYPTFAGSPASKGLFQWDLWEAERRGLTHDEYLMLPKDEWYYPKGYPRKRIDRLRSDLITHGMKNSMLTSLMPTASTAHIIGNNESFEPFNGMLYKRKILAGTFVFVNKYFLSEAQRLGVWSDELFQHIIENKGYISKYDNWGTMTPDDVAMLKKKYLSVYELRQRILLDLSADRGRFICQSQSMNCHMQSPTIDMLNAYHFHGWKLGLKTGMYYLRQMQLSEAINVAKHDIKIEPQDNDVEEICVSCQV